MSLKYTSADIKLSPTYTLKVKNEIVRVHSGKRPIYISPIF